MASVYRALCVETGKSYVGFTSGTLDKRRRQHESAALGMKASCPLFYRALRKYGVDAFQWSVLAEAARPLALALEALAIWTYDSLGGGYNLSEGGEAPEWTAESREKIGARTRGISKPMTAAVEAARFVNTGRKWSESERTNVVAARAKSPKVAAARVRGQEARRGSKNTPEHNTKIGAAHRRLSPEKADWARRQIASGRSASDLARELGVSKQTMSRVKQRTHGY